MKLGPLDPGEFAALHLIAVRIGRLSEARIAAARLVIQEGKTYKYAAELHHVTAQAVAQSSPGALYLSGGDVAIAVAHALGATGFQIRGRVAECVPYGHFLGGRWSRPVMTKAGGFGTDTTLLHVVNFIEEKLSV